MNAMKLAVPLLVALAYGPSQGLAAPILGADLASFAVLGASEVTNVPTSTIVGNVGVSAGSSITGFGTTSPGTITSDPQVTGGGVHTTTTLLGVGSPNAASAQLDLDTARTNLGLLGGGTLLPVDLTGLTIFPGIFTLPAGTTNLSGAVTLDGLGNSNAFWLFQVTSTLITSATSSLTVTDVGTGAGVGVFWNVGSAATLDGPTFAGNVLAHDLISSDGDLTIACGRLLSAETKVTLIHDKISIGCAGTEASSKGFSGGSALEFETGTSGLVVADTTTPFDTTTQTHTVVSVPGAFVPEPGTLMLLGFGLAGLFAFRKNFFALA